MSKLVTLRKSGNSRVLTVPSEVEASVGSKFEVRLLSDGSIVYKPFKHNNVFASPDWQEYDYQRDIQEDPEIAEVKAVGKERG